MAPSSVVNNAQELRITLPNQICSPSPMWSYHSNLSDDLSPPCVIPPSPFNIYQSWLGLGHLGTEASLLVPEIPSPNIPNRESRPMRFGRGRGRGLWAPR